MEKSMETSLDNKEVELGIPQGFDEPKKKKIKLDCDHEDSGGATDANKTVKIDFLSKLPELVTRQLVKLLNRETLKNLRLVSKAYEQFTNPYLKFFGKPWISIIRRSYSIDGWNLYIRGGNKVIKNHNWSSEFVPNFHILSLGDIWHRSLPPHSRDGIEVQQLISNLSPYITKLFIDWTPSWNTEKSGEQLTHFFAQFTNLKKLTIGEMIYQMDLKLAIKKQQTIFQSLKSNVQINVTITSPNEWILETLKNQPKIQFYLKIKSISSLEKLENLSTICTRYKRRISSLEIGCICLEMDFDDLDQKIVNEYLDELSFKVTKIGKAVGENLDLLSSVDRIWPKLNDIGIDGYGGPLEFLKNCPELKYLSLRLADLNPCIYYHQAKSVKDNIKEVFGNLTKLKELWVWSPDNEELKLYMKEILPQVRIN